MREVSSVERQVHNLLGLYHRAQRRIGGFEVDRGRLDRDGFLGRSYSQSNVLSAGLIDENMQSRLRRGSKSIFCYFQNVFTRRHAHENIQPGIVGETLSLRTGVSILENYRCLRNYRTARIPNNSVESGCGLRRSSIRNYEYQYKRNT